MYVLLNVRVQSVKKMVIKSGRQREKGGNRIVIELWKDDEKLRENEE